MIFLDANVFLYAAGADHPMRPSCRAILGALRSSRITGATSTEVLQELLHVLTRRNRQQEALALSRSVLEAFTVLPVDAAVMAGTIELLEEHPRLQVRDAIHVAAMRAAGLARIVSADRGFDGIRGIERVAPDRYAEESGL